MIGPPPGGARDRDPSRGHLRHRMALAAVLALSLFVAWRIVATAVAGQNPRTVTALLDGAGADGPEARPRSSPGRGLVIGAAAVARARALLDAEPLSSDAYVVLALAADRAGRDDDAARLMRVAASWWPRDPLSQTWLLDRDLRRGDGAGAMTRFDAIARSRPDALEGLAEALAPVLRDPAASAALIGYLAADPPWRTPFIDAAIRHWREPDGLVGLLERLQAGPSGLKPPELRPLVAKLLQVGRLDQAYLMWLRSLPRDRLSDLTYLYNGGFQYPVSDMPFDWTLPAVPGASAALSTEGTRRVLTVGFLGGRVPLPPVRHDLVLAPGAYRLTGNVRTDRLRAERGVRWRLACRDDADGALATSEPFVGSAARRDFAVPFVIPETGCRTQTLGLEVDARTESERRVSGIVAFSGLDIEDR